MRARLTQTLPLLWISFCFTLHAGQPIGTTFSYRGSLSAGGMPAAGTFDLRFTLFDQSTNGLQVAAAVTNAAVFMNNGLFNVSLDFGPGAFNGERRWLEIGVRTNGSLADFETLTPRQELAAQPYALYAANAGSATVARDLAQGTFAGPFSLTNASNVFTGNGSGLSGVNATTLGGFGPGGFWHTSGNSGTSAGPNFLGTLDNQPLELKVSAARAFRLEPTASGSPNLIGGAPANFVPGGISGATISGGGALTSGESNSVAESFGTVGGGSGNSISELQSYGTIPGGHSNAIAEVSNWYPNANSTIGGGFSNTIWVSSSVIAGGAENWIGNPFSAMDYGHTIGGGIGNYIGYQIRGATIGGGLENWADSQDSTVAGGSGNSIYWTDGDSHSIGGGLNNQIYANSGCGISSGNGNAIGTLNGKSGASFSTIGGGLSNLLFGAYSTIGGGEGNLIDRTGPAFSADEHATISGGFSNLVSAKYATVPGGAQATARLFGQMAYGSGQFSSPGDAQSSLFVCRGVTTNATQGELFLDGASARMVVPTNSTWSFEILISGRAANGNSAAFRFLGAIKNNNGALSLLGTPLKNALGQDVPSWDASLAADTPNQDLSLRVTGQASTSIRWVANVRTTEVAY